MLCANPIYKKDTPHEARKIVKIPKNGCKHGPCMPQIQLNLLLNAYIVSSLFVSITPLISVDLHVDVKTHAKPKQKLKVFNCRPHFLLMNLQCVKKTKFHYNSF